MTMTIDCVLGSDDYDDDDDDDNARGWAAQSPGLVPGARVRGRLRAHGTGGQGPFARDTCDITFLSGS